MDGVIRDMLGEVALARARFSECDWMAGRPAHVPMVDGAAFLRAPGFIGGPVDVLSTQGYWVDPNHSDGRDVAPTPTGGANMATQQEIDNLIASVNATSTALEVLSVAHNSGGLVKGGDVVRVAEKLVAMVTKLGEYTTQKP